jgi:hypothetical protein
MKKEVVPGEWQEEIDPFTKAVNRFRMVGNVKEYEMMVTIDGCQVPESQVEAFNKRKKERKEQREAERQKYAQEAAKKPVYSCPFNHNGLNSTCRQKDCAFFNGKDCVVREVGTDPTASEGKKCPIDIYNRVCNSNCAFNKGGCILPGIISKLSQKGCANNE